MYFCISHMVFIQGCELQMSAHAKFLMSKSTGLLVSTISKSLPDQFEPHIWLHLQMQKVGCTAPRWPSTPRFSRLSQPALLGWTTSSLLNCQAEAVSLFLDPQKYWMIWGYPHFRKPPYDIILWSYYDHWSFSFSGLGIRLGRRF